EPGWDSPWGQGRPGWHIECSAMSERYLGTTFDIHGGGLDLIFPHHENEIAQSRCAHGTHAIANIWMHNGFLQVEGQKMSKSVGNFITINDLLDSWGGSVLRLNMLKTHYRQPIDWTQSSLKETGRELSRWLVAVQDTEDRPVPAEVVELLSDDLNSHTVLTLLRQYYSTDELASLRAGMQLLGLSAVPGAEQGRKHKRMYVEAGHFGNLDLDALVAERLEALNSKDFAKADELRRKAESAGWSLVDSKDETGARQTKWEIER
ncbi:MAG: class I tRNA ligase family protein, partial [Candidatus Devosia euplotis]|nr:class I tRNA ligase family protein [Candidatus Devosia euplotis]